MRQQRSEAKPKTHVLFVHGSCHGAWCWEPVLRPVLEAAGYQVHSFDLPGHGEDQRHGIFSLLVFQTWGIAHYTRAVAAKVAALSLTEPAEQLVLVGHSMGTHVVAAYLEKAPVAAAVFLAPVPPQGTGGSLVRLIKNPDTRREVLGALFTANFYRLVQTPARARRVFWAHCTEAEGVAFHRLLSRESLRSFLDGWFLSRPNPAHWGVNNKAWRLVLGGANDAVFAREETEATATAYQANCHIFEGMAHDLMLGPGSTGVAKYIAEWLASKSL